jgi:hypothetical protein
MQKEGMNMAIQNCTKALVRYNDGKLWYVYNNTDALEYKVFENGKFTSEGICVVNKVLSGFATDMDKRDKLHVLCQSLQGELTYLHYNGQQWDKQILTKYNPTHYIMKYPVLKLNGSDIHVIFAMGNAYNTSDWTMYHYMWHQTQWKTLKIGSLNIGNLIDPFQIDWDTEGNIYLIFRDKDEKNLYRIFHSFFDSSFRIWSKPQPLTPDDKGSGCPALLIDGANMHLAWNNAYNNRVCVEYAALPLNKRKEASIKKSSVISPNNTDAEHPLLCSFDHKLWLIWSSNKVINSMYSNDQGITWHRHDPVILPNNAEPQFLRYLDQRFPNLGSVYGCIDNGLKLVPPIPLSEPASVENPVKIVSTVEAEEKPLNVVTEQSILSKDMENMAYQLDMIKTRQNELLQLLSKADQHFQEISNMLKEISKLVKDIKSKNLHQAGFMSMLKKWLSK